MDRENYYISETERKWVCDLFEEGKDLDQIVAITGRSKSSVQNTLGRAGIDWRMFSHEIKVTPKLKNEKYKYPKVWVAELGKYMYDDTYNKIWDGTMYRSKYGCEIGGKSHDEYWERVDE